MNAVSVQLWIFVFLVANWMLSLDLNSLTRRRNLQLLPMFALYPASTNVIETHLSRTLNLSPKKGSQNMSVNSSIKVRTKPPRPLPAWPTFCGPHNTKHNTFNIAVMYVCCCHARYDILIMSLIKNASFNLCIELISLCLLSRLYLASIWFGPRSC